MTENQPPDASGGQSRFSATLEPIKIMNYAKNQGGFYYIEVRPITLYKSFRTLGNAGEKSGIECVVGQRADGVWDTVKWLIGKELAHVENDRLVADHEDAQNLFDRLRSEPKRIEGNRFEAKERDAGRRKNQPTEARKNAGKKYQVNV